MSKNERLQAKIEHIEHQIEALRNMMINRKEVLGKMNAEILPMDKEIEFQFWRIDLMKQYKKLSAAKLRERLADVGEPKDLKGIATKETLQLALGEYGEVD